MNLRNKKLVRTIQILFGLYLLLGGIMGILMMLGVQLPGPEFNEAGMAFINAVLATSYITELMSLVFLAVGIMFVFNKWSALGAVLLVPITLNILLFHIFLDFTGFIGAAIVFLLNVYMIGINWHKYKPMLSNK